MTIEYLSERQKLNDAKTMLLADKINMADKINNNSPYSCGIRGCIGRRYMGRNCVFKDPSMDGVSKDRAPTCPHEVIDVKESIFYRKTIYQRQNGNH